MCDVRVVWRSCAVTTVALAILIGCSGDDASSSPPTQPARGAESYVSVHTDGNDPDAGTGTSTTVTTSVDPFRADLRDELIEMQRADQFERTGEGAPAGTKLPPIDDYGRTERLKEIVAEVGWPTVTLVGQDGASAAWLIAQHADHDVEFQRRAVGMLADAVADGEADPIDLAYLSDRLAVNEGRPQEFGTQIRCRNGVPDPATPLLDPDGIEDLRASVGLGTLADYYDELALPCADEAAQGVDLDG